VSSRFPDDTALDAIAAQVRSFAPLSPREMADLLDQARRSPGGPAAGRLVEQNLGAVLDGVLARRGSAADLMDLYQEGALAATVAVNEYASRGGPAEGLHRYVARVVDKFLEDVLERERLARIADALLVEQVKLLEAAEVILRRRLEREPTTLELAAAMEWTPELVEVVAGVLHRAREAYDAEILDYLDDADGDDGDTPDI
jgi:DNA-directed RNA polymerase sigma subunit (sigma70/sigma32)